MKDMVKIFPICLILTLTLVYSYPLKVEGLDNCFTNNNDIYICNEDYNRLINLGFTENEIKNMDYDEFTLNDNIVGQVVSETTQYYSTTSLVSNNQIIELNSEQITEDEFLNGSTELVTPTSLVVGNVETNHKKMVTKIIKISDTLFRYKVTLTWKNMPSVKSNDIIGIGINTTVTIKSSLYSKQNYCDKSNNCSSTKPLYSKKTSTGAGAVIAIPDLNLSSLESYLYFDVVKSSSGTLKTLYAYGDYAHAITTVNSSKSKNFSINSSGIVLGDTIKSKYDEIQVAKANWTGTW